MQLESAAKVDTAPAPKNATMSIARAELAVFIRTSYSVVGKADGLGETGAAEAPPGRDRSGGATATAGSPRLIIGQALYLRKEIDKKIYIYD